MVNVPVNARFAARAAASFNKRDGWLNPVLGNAFTAGSSPTGRNEQDDWSSRLSGLWKFGASSSFLLVTGTFGHVGGVGATNAIYNSVRNKESGAAVRNVYYNPFGGQLNPQNFHNYNGELNLEFGAKCAVTYDGGHLYYTRNDRTSSTNDTRVSNSGGRYNWTLYRGNATVDSHELRFANAQPQRFEWVAGANYYNEDLGNEATTTGACRSRRPCNRPASTASTR